MNAINPYVGFNGKCREAMSFYQQCFGGELEFQEVAATPVKQFSAGEKDKIYHSSLAKDGLPILMGSDMTDGEGYSKGNNIALAISCNSEEDIYSLFDKLGKDGKVSAPLKEEFWGGIFGRLTDQFGIEWMLNFSKG